MAARRKPLTPPGPDDRAYTVRWIHSRKFLATDPLTRWRWSEPSQAMQMTLEEAQYAAARMGGIVCVDGVPIDKLGVKPPEKPRSIPGESVGATSKTDRVREHVEAERWRDALRLAVRLNGLGDDQKPIERAWTAITNPNFMRQIKQDPDALVAAGIEILRRRWGSGREPLS